VYDLGSETRDSSDRVSNHVFDDGHLAVVKLLIDMHPQLLDQKDFSAETALHRAVACYASRDESTQDRLQEVMRLLIEKGANVNTVGGRGQTPLFDASKGNLGHNWPVKFLLQHGANINHQDEQGKTALWMAACWLKMATMHCLLQNGADATIRSHRGESPRDIAVRGCSGRAKDVVKLLDDHENMLSLKQKEKNTVSLFNDHEPNNSDNHALVHLNGLKLPQLSAAEASIRSGGFLPPLPPPLLNPWSDFSTTLV
jgi:ankyrin repeat protein